MATRFANPAPQFFYNGTPAAPLAGGLMYFYEPGSSLTPKNTYSDNALSIPNSNPVILSSSGVLPNVFLDGAYRVILKDKNGVQQWDRDSINSISLLAFGDWDPTINYGIGGQNIVYASDGIYYISIDTPNLGNEPSISPLYWMIAIDYFLQSQTSVPPGQLAIGSDPSGIEGLNTTPKGTIAAGNGTTTVALPVGADGLVLKSNSLASSGIQWSPEASRQLAIVERSSNTILVEADSGNLIKITANTFSQTITAAATLGANWYVYYQNAGTGTITLDPDGGETINGAATLAVGSGQVVILSCDGANFKASVLATYVGDHSVVVTTGNGLASTNTKIRIFTTIKTSSGTAITYATSATAGNSFTINEAGLYEVSYIDAYTTTAAVAGFGISVNSNELTTGVNAITASNLVAYTTAVGDPVAGNGAACVTRTLRLSAGDVIRAHVGSGNTPDTTAASSSQVSITKVGV